MLKDGERGERGREREGGSREGDKRERPSLGESMTSWHLLLSLPRQKGPTTLSVTDTRGETNCPSFETARYGREHVICDMVNK